MPGLRMRGLCQPGQLALQTPRFHSHIPDSEPRWRAKRKKKIRSFSNSRWVRGPSSANEIGPSAGIGSSDGTDGGPVAGLSVRRAVGGPQTYLSRAKVGQIDPSSGPCARAMRRARPDRPEGTRDSGSETVYSARTRGTNGPDTDTLTPADIQRTSTRLKVRVKKAAIKGTCARDAAVPPHAAGAWLQRAHGLSTHAGGGPGRRQAHGKGWGGCAHSPAVGLGRSDRTFTQGVQPCDASRAPESARGYTRLGFRDRI